MEQLQDFLPPIKFLALVDASTFMNEHGWFHPGLRAMGKRHGMSKSTMGRRIAEWVALGIMTVVKRGGRATNRYHIHKPAYVRELLKAREFFYPGFRELHWRKDGKSDAAQAFLEPLSEPTWTPESGTEGNPYSPSQSPASLPTEPRARALRAAPEQPHPDPTSSVESPANAQASDGHQCEGANGSAAPRLTAAEVIEKAVAALDLLRRFGVQNPHANASDTARAALDRTQSADRCQARNSGDDAERPSGITARNDPATEGRKPARYLRKSSDHRLHDDRSHERNDDQDAGRRRGHIASRAATQATQSNRPGNAPLLRAPLVSAVKAWASENLGLFIDEYGTWEDRKAYWRGDSETIYRFARWKASIDWKPPPEVRARHKFHQKASGVAKDERERRKQLCIMANASWLNPADRPAFWQAMIAERWDILDQIDAARRQSIGKTGPKRWPGGGKNRGNFDGEGRKVRERCASDTVAPASRARISVGKSGEIFHKFPYATHFEVLGKSFSGGERLGKEANVRSFNDEALTRSANTYAEDRSATRQYADGGTQTRVRNQRAASDRGCPGGPAQSWEEPRLRQRSALAEPPEDQALSWGHVVGSDGAAHPAAAGPGGLTQEGLPPAGGALAGGTLLPRTYDFLQKRPPKNKFRQIEGLPPSTWLVP